MKSSSTCRKNLRSPHEFENACAFSAESYSYEYAAVLTSGRRSRGCRSVATRNITAVMAGFLKLFDLRIIESLPAISGCSRTANRLPYYIEPKPRRGATAPSRSGHAVAQAAMSGNRSRCPRDTVVEQVTEGSPERRGADRRGEREESWIDAQGHPPTGTSPAAGWRMLRVQEGRLR